jgi:hypothetical protein
MEPKTTFRALAMQKRSLRDSSNIYLKHIHTQRTTWISRVALWRNYNRLLWAAGSAKCEDISFWGGAGSVRFTTLCPRRRLPGAPSSHSVVRPPLGSRCPRSSHGNWGGQLPQCLLAVGPGGLCPGWPGLQKIRISTVTQNASRQ